jgi:hypothetical protein
VKSLLENAQTTISPTPQRIIWCYGQWQPSYFDMMGIMPPNDLATHNNATFAKFKTCLLIQITDDSV